MKYYWISDFSIKQALRVLLSGWLFFAFNSAASAQVTDTTRQQPQLQTSPPATVPVRPAPTAPSPAYPLPDSLKKNPATVEPENQPARQEPPRKASVLEKLFIGGSGDLGFRSDPYFGNYFNIGASPLLGYRITKQLAVGPGLVYQFYSMGGDQYQDYGAKAFAQLIIYRSIFAHVEHELLNAQEFIYDAQGRLANLSRHNIQTTLAGGGYRQMASDRFGIDLYVLFPVAASANNPINSSQPVIRAGVIYNLK